MYKLIIEDDEGKTTVVPLIRDEISIGRKEGNTIRLTERNVSRRHARIIRQNGTIYIEDLNSYNGIKVNGDRITGRAAIGEGDRIQIGDYQLSVKLDKSEPKSNPPRAGASPDETVTTPFQKQQLAGEPTTQIQVQAPASASSVPTVPTPVVSAAAAGATERPARLIVISKQFFRQEFPLDKAAVVIGRTDENDVVINHRSISRHHAKIVREGGRYHIIDLQSSNGVRVNGEEYGKVELRKGDQIDLGHVRLVFVPPGQDYEISKPVDTERTGQHAALLVGLLLVVAIVGGMVALRHLGVRLPLGPRSADVEGEAAKILVDIDSDLLGKRWDEALAKAEQVLAMEGLSQKLRETTQAKQDKAIQERKAKQFYDRFAAAAGERRYDEAMQLYRELPVDSIYKQMARETYDKIFPLFVADHLDRAERARLARNCQDFHEEIQRVLLLEPNHIRALEMKSRPCEDRPGAQEAPAAREGPRKRSRGERERTLASGSRPQADATEPAEKPSSEDADAVLREAQNAYLNGDFARAIELARPVRGNSANAATRAWRIIGAAACNLKDLRLVTDAYRHLDPNARQFIVYVCQRSGVVFAGGQFKLAE
ncbi:MAG: FHA domain-containing protein [Myxococcales bacterium]|nr:FHA domain-containing protein [Myxococcota bacterium]MDW8281623.1 FHA domain-containing protein [Myxococcales bacterium]